MGAVALVAGAGGTALGTASPASSAAGTGIGSVKAGHQAAVLATVSGSTATSARVIDLSLVGMGPRWGRPPAPAG